MQLISLSIYPPNHENIHTKTRPQHRELRSLLFANSEWVLLRPTELFTNKGCETGPTVYPPYPRRLESLTICKCHYKSSTFSSVILRPWVVVRPGFEPTTSRTVVRHFTNWANRSNWANRTSAYKNVLLTVGYLNERRRSFPLSIIIKSGLYKEVL